MTAPDHTTRAVELTEAAVAGIDAANPGEHVEPAP